MDHNDNESRNAAHSSRETADKKTSSAALPAEERQATVPGSSPLFATTFEETAQKRWVVTVFVIFGLVLAVLIGYFVWMATSPDSTRQGVNAEQMAGTLSSTETAADNATTAVESQPTSSVIAEGRGNGNGGGDNDPLLPPGTRLGGHDNKTNTPPSTIRVRPNDPSPLGNKDESTLASNSDTHTSDTSPTQGTSTTQTSGSTSGSTTSDPSNSATTEPSRPGSSGSTTSVASKPLTNTASTANPTSEEPQSVKATSGQVNIKVTPQAEPEAATPSATTGTSPSAAAE